MDIRMQRSVVFLVAGLIQLLVQQPSIAADEIFRLVDVRGDDFGAGDLVYPNRDDFQQGSLDLEWLSARAANDGTWFRARMGREIASPRGRVTDVGGEALESLARHDFYTFNLDLYIDSDRIAGSGQTATLPGRVVDVHRDNAWERAVILTPRPDVARAWYMLHLGQVREAELRAEKGKVERVDIAAIDAEIEREIDRSYFFPNRIRVRGREIEFFVPDAFLDGPARKEWCYTALVTGADVEQPGRLLNVSPGGFMLMAMPLAPGRSADRFGIVNRGDLNQPPVVDVLAPDVESQKRALSDYDVAAPRFATVPGISPAEQAVLLAHTPSVTDGPARSAGGDGDVAPVPAAATPVEPATPDARPDISTRLKTLDALRQDGLVSEDEYWQLRRGILSEI